MNAVITNTKRCSKCKVTKARSTDNYARNKALPDGFDNYCKPCRAVATRLQYHKDRNPEYYKLANDKREAFLSQVLSAYDEEHVRAITLGTKERYDELRSALKRCITEARKHEPVKAKILARYYKTLTDVSPWPTEIQFPQEWRAMSKWLRLTGQLNLYQWLRTHYEVQHGNVDA